MRRKTIVEYPASHSVDTDWFAIDKYGNLACMSAGEDAPIPVSISTEHMEDDKYYPNFLIELAEDCGDNCYGLQIPAGDIEDCIKAIINRTEDYKPFWDEGGMIIFTDGISVKELELWTNRPESSLAFFFNHREDSAIIIGIPDSEHVLKDINTGHIRYYWDFDYRCLGLFYEAWRHHGEYSIEDNGCIYRLRIKAYDLNRNFKYLLEFNGSFNEYDCFYFYDYFYGHNPGSIDSHPLDELRHKFSEMTEKEREKELFKSISEENERAVGILFKEFKVSPFAVNDEGIPLLDYAYSVFGGKHNITEEDFRKNSSICAIIKMIELRSGEVEDEKDRT